MGQLRSPAAVRSSSCSGWRRQRMRRWRRPNDLFGISTMFAVIPSLPRAELTHLTQRMIDRMDELDGDPDREDDGQDRCEAGEDVQVGGPVSYLEWWGTGSVRIGSDDDAESAAPFRDQETTYD